MEILRRAEARNGLVSGRRVSSSVVDDRTIKVPFAGKLLGSRNDATMCRQESFAPSLAKSKSPSYCCAGKNEDQTRRLDIGRRSMGFPRRPSWQNLQARCTVIDAMLRRSDQR